jgi:hypothetical protein
MCRSEHKKHSPVCPFLKLGLQVEQLSVEQFIKFEVKRQTFLVVCIIPERSFISVQYCLVSTKLGCDTFWDQARLLAKCVMELHQSMQTVATYASFAKGKRIEHANVAWKKSAILYMYKNYINQSRIYCIDNRFSLHMSVFFIVLSTRFQHVRVNNNSIHLDQVCVYFCPCMCSIFVVCRVWHVRVQVKRVYSIQYNHYY